MNETKEKNLYKRSLDEDLDNLLNQCEPQLTKEWENNFKGFKNLFATYLDSEALDWNKIHTPDDNTVISIESLEIVKEQNIGTLLNKLVVIKLNGGLGTTMGCSGPKSLINVRNGMTFLDVTMKQLECLNLKYGTDIPLILMNSFNTDVDTRKVLYKYENYKTKILCFTQNQYPRILKESKRPVATHFDPDNKHSWYPPGHGNFYESFYSSGLLDKMLDAKKTLAFVSNIDNLGATINMEILNSMFSSNETNNAYDYIIEVTKKTKSDIKGGTIIRYDGKPRLLEIAQVPKGHEEDFKSPNIFKIFNTNNIWVNISSIKSLFTQNKMNLDVIINNKTLDDGRNVIQLETAIGAAIKNFDKTIAITVPRSRFLPVKNNSDLLLIMSNLYNIEEGKIFMNPKRQFDTTPFVKFSGEYFLKVSEFLNRFSGIPDILELDHLTVSGDVTFGSDVVLKGTVIIIAHHGERIDIPPGAILENKIVSGNLRILSH